MYHLQYQTHDGLHWYELGSFLTLAEATPLAIELIKAGFAVKIIKV